MKCLISIFILISFLGCVRTEYVKQPPKIITEYKTTRVPVYVNPLDNITIKEPSALTKFYFSEKGSVCLTKDTTKILLKDLIILKDERKMYYEMLETLK